MRRKLYIFVVCTALLGVLIVSWWARQPSVSTPTTGVSQVKAATTDDTVEYINDYLRMQLPKRFVAKQPVIGSGKPIYFQQLLTAPLQNSGGVFSDQIAVVVGALPVGGLVEVSDVQLRARSSEYAIVATNTPNVVAYESVDSPTYEIGYFIGGPQKYASVVLTTSLANKNQAEEQTKNTLRTLEWRN